MRVLGRVAASVVVAIGFAGLTAGSVSAVRSREANSPDNSTRANTAPALVRIEFHVSGDLAGMDGLAQHRGCIQNIRPNPFQIFHNRLFLVDVDNNSLCVGGGEAVLTLKSHPKSAKDPPEYLTLRVRIDDRGAHAAFDGISRDLHYDISYLKHVNVAVQNHVVVKIFGT